MAEPNKPARPRRILFQIPFAADENDPKAKPRDDIAMFYLAAGGVLTGAAWLLGKLLTQSLPAMPEDRVWLNTLGHSAAFVFNRYVAYVNAKIPKGNEANRIYVNQFNTGGVSFLFLVTLPAYIAEQYGDANKTPPDFLAPYL